MKSFNDWVNEGRINETPGTSYSFYLNRRIECADGYTVSIQASSGHYCLPRESFEDVAMYHAFELGFPSVADAEMLEYADDPGEPTDTVYGYVPREIVEKVIKSHGGITGFVERPKS